MDKVKIVEALKRAAVIMVLVAIIAGAIGAMASAIFEENGWLLLWWIPLSGAISFLMCLNPFGWFDNL